MPYFRKKFAVNAFCLVTVFAVIVSLVSCGRNRAPSIDEQPGAIEYYTCGMHPSVRVTPQEYKSGKTNCPICNMRLTAVHKEGPAPVAESESYYGCGMEGAEHVFTMRGIKKDMKCPICGMPLKKLSKKEADKLKGVVSTVKIKASQAERAGVRTEPARRLRLFKEIRTVGKVAYDPGLAIAEEEFISSLNSLERIKEGNVAEIKERAARLVEASRRKLRLLGLSEEQIEELGETKKIHTSLILPEEKMWIYGDVYEYELGWVKTGEKVKVTATSLPGETFRGVISSVNPVLDPKTRSVTFRAEVDNPGFKLKPEMYVDIVIMGEYDSPDRSEKALAIPKSAILDTGARKIVWVKTGSGEYEGRAVILGPEATARADGEKRDFYPVLKGIKEGELVVTRANFLVDSQSQLTGTASTAYTGALGKSEEEGRRPSHQH